MVNTVANGAWLLCYLARDKHWYSKVQSEIDKVLESHRHRTDETAVDILPRVTLGEWETALPTLDLCLKETIRLTVNGTCVRKNLGSRDVFIPGTDEVVPPQAYCVCRCVTGSSEGVLLTMAVLHDFGGPFK